MMNTTVCVCVPDHWVQIRRIMWQISFEPTVTGSLLPISETSDTTRNGDFSEVSHRDCDGDTGILEIMRAYHDCGYTGYVRPDHGRHLWEKKPIADRATDCMTGHWESCICGDVGICWNGWMENLR